MQTHQRAERDAAIARLEQSRIVLAMRLGEHHGKKHKVIEEALAFVGDVQDAAIFVENMHDFKFKSGILEEKMCDFCLNGVFWKGKCMIFG